MVAQCGLPQKALRRHPALASRGKVPRIPAKPVHFPLRFAQVNPIRRFRFTCRSVTVVWMPTVCFAADDVCEGKTFGEWQDGWCRLRRLTVDR